MTEFVRNSRSQDIIGFRHNVAPVRSIYRAPFTSYQLGRGYQASGFVMESLAVYIHAQSVAKGLTTMARAS
jgi:hypothetical protein